MRLISSCTNLSKLGFTSKVCIDDACIEITNGSLRLFVEGFIYRVIPCNVFPYNIWNLSIYFIHKWKCLDMAIQQWLFLALWTLLNGHIKILFILGSNRRKRLGLYGTHFMELPIAGNLLHKDKCIHVICIVHVDPCIVDTDAWILLLDMFHWGHTW